MERARCSVDEQRVSLSGWLGDDPLEAIVQMDDGIRTQQYRCAMKGEPYRHSVNIASNFEERPRW